MGGFGEMVNNGEDNSHRLGSRQSSYKVYPYVGPQAMQNGEGV